VLADHGGWKRYESDAEQLQEREPHQTAIEAPHVLEENEVPDPEIGDDRKTGEKGEEFGPVFEQAPEESVSMEIRRRLGQDQIHGEKGKSYGVHAVCQKDEPVETRVLLGRVRSGRTGIVVFGYENLLEALVLVPHDSHRRLPIDAKSR